MESMEHSTSPLIQAHLDARFPHTDLIPLPCHDDEDATFDVPRHEVEAILSPFITPERLALLEQVVAARVYSVVPVLEGLCDEGNISAVMRSAEALGFGAMHIIEGEILPKNPYKRITRGTDKWLDVERWGIDETLKCAQTLKDRGYRLVATHLSEDAVPAHEVDFTQPTAIIFGNEHAGVSDALLAECDARCIIPMSGFAQSFNISVAAALVLHQARVQLGERGDLTDAQQATLRGHFLARAVRHAGRIIAAQQAQDAS